MKTQAASQDDDECLIIVNDRIVLDEEDIKALCILANVFLYQLPTVMCIAYKMFRACGSPTTADAYDVMTEPAVAVKHLEKLLMSNGWNVKELEN